MSEIKFPIVIDGYKCVEDMAQAVLNYTYKGKTLKEWADSISESQTRADKIRAMTDEELADMFSLLSCCHEKGQDCMKYSDGTGGRNCYQCWLDWLKQEVGE